MTRIAATVEPPVSVGNATPKLTAGQTGTGFMDVLMQGLTSRLLIAQGELGAHCQARLDAQNPKLPCRGDVQRVIGSIHLLFERQPKEFGS